MPKKKMGPSLKQLRLDVRSLVRRTHTGLVRIDQAVDLFTNEKEVSVVERSLLRMAITALWVMDQEWSKVSLDG